MSFWTYFILSRREFCDWTLVCRRLRLSNTSSDICRRRTDALVGLAFRRPTLNGLNAYKFVHKGQPQLRFKICHLLIGTTIVAGALAAPKLSLRFPGSLYFDSSGRPQGTGLKKYFYESGAVMIDEHYSVGEMTRSIWYRPDGSILANVPIPDKSKSYVGFYLNQNGTIRKKVTYRFVTGNRLWLADGPCECFDEDGKPAGTETYSNGRPLATQ